MPKFQAQITIDTDIDDLALRAIVTSIDQTLQECPSPNATFRDCNFDMSESIIKTYNALARLKQEFEQIIKECDSYYV